MKLLDNDVATPKMTQKPSLVEFPSMRAPAQQTGHPSALLSRLRAELSERWQRGDPVRVEDYLERHPELVSEPEALVGLIYAEVLLRLESGETPTLDEYLQRFPEHADSLRQCWAIHRLIVDPQPVSLATVSEDATAAPGPAAARTRAIPPLSQPGYEVLEELGKGGMGIVFKARQVAFNRLVAVKMIRSWSLASGEERLRFGTEAEALGRLDHPHIVRVFAFGEEQDCPFFVMEYLPGGSLSRLLRGGTLPIRRAAEVVRQVALGVQAAHDQDILHRDLKPGNVLLDSQGNARVADFGLAKLLDSDGAQTVSAAVMGTPSYMAPEQAAGRTRAIGRAADVWALGVILYECLTGKLPFSGATRQETLRLVQLAQPLPPRRLRAEVPAELEAICLKCLYKEPDQRYPSAAALADDLRAWLEGRTPSVCACNSLPAWLRRHPRSLLVSIACLGALLVGLFLPRRAAPEAQDETQPRVLIGEKDLPDWWLSMRDSAPRFRLGREHARLSRRRKDGFASLTGGGTEPILIDLNRRIPWERYRIHLQIRHENSDPLGAVGLYFGASAYSSATGTLHRCLLISFNDATNDNQFMAPIPAVAKQPPAAGNCLRGRLYYTGELGNGRMLNYTVSPFFSPALVKVGRQWRTLDVEVSPPDIRVLWEKNTLAGKFNMARIDKAVQASLRLLKEKYPNHQGIQGLPTSFDLRGAVGLYLFWGSASFRQARIEPLDDRGQNEERQAR
jgi:serine/threonine protein kinase